ncbi:DUF3440 domain-containing protein [Vibrio brasiliensis]|uniref:DUF3440 domain-containing protein n=1 Tax=Vibrio brasiliensis TaxID=170652 RepID=UPI001EFC5F86|nr:DUF3440 domain-containing protein [Vibrio brasiliensis]
MGSVSGKQEFKDNVYVAAQKRVSYIFDDFEHFYISLSGGKDSAVLLNLAIEEGERRGRLPLDVLIIDFEAQFEQTEKFLKRLVSSGKINVYWVCLPISLRNAVSQFQPKWMCWDPREKHRWVRSIPEVKGVISKAEQLPFFKVGVEFEDFVCQFASWYQQQKKTQVAVLIGIRADESLNRYKTIRNKKKLKYKSLPWTTKMLDDVYMAYPIYDWKTKDIWIANARYGWDYNRIYDLMHQAGVKLSLQRLCQPFGDEQRKGLWLYRILEPHTWQKLVDRVEGCNFGARYTKEQGRILGYYRFKLPEGFTYRQYSKYLLNTMPPKLSLHYRQRIFKFLLWWKNNGPARGVTNIPDYADSKLEASKKVPSWRRICKVLVKNDYCCRGLSFSYNKSDGRAIGDLNKS